MSSRRYFVLFNLSMKNINTIFVILIRACTVILEEIRNKSSWGKYYFLYTSPTQIVIF